MTDERTIFKRPFALRVVAVLAGVAFNVCIGADSNRPTLFLIGDSTVKNGSKDLCGWGEKIGSLFDTNRIQVANCAIGGRSSRSFFTEGIRDNVPALAQHLRTDIAPFDPATPDSVERVNIPPSPIFSTEKPAGS